MSLTVILFEVAHVILSSQCNSHVYTLIQNAATCAYHNFVLHNIIVMVVIYIIFGAMIETESVPWLGRL